MLRNLLDEVRRRHLWPIPVIAVVVAVAAPMLFLKSAPTDVPVGSETAPAAPPAGRLPVGAERLLATSDARKRAARERSRKADPFQGPSSGGGDDDAAAEEKSSSDDKTTSTTPEPVPVVITNADGTTLGTSPPSDAITTPLLPSPIGDVPTKAIPSTGPMVVDVRFGERIPGTLHRSIPQLQTFVAGDSLVAIFVKYSPTRDKAVFAIAPDSLLSGDIDCRRKDGVCRYVDIPAGKGVRLTTTTSLGIRVTRRLDVVRIAPASGIDSAAASTAPADGGCLLGKLLTLSPDDPPLAGDACSR